MDIKAKVEEIIGKIKSDPQFASKFQADPVKAVEGVLGVDLPDDQINAVISTVKAQLAGGAIADKLAGLFGKQGK